MKSPAPLTALILCTQRLCVYYKSQTSTHSISTIPFMLKKGIVPYKCRRPFDQRAKIEAQKGDTHSIQTRTNARSQSEQRPALCELLIGRQWCTYTHSTYTE